MIDQVRKAPDLTGVVAVLWTWLEQHIAELGSLQVNMFAECLTASKVPFTGLSEPEFAALSNEPLLGAARLLGRIARSLRVANRQAASATRAKGFDGADVAVIWKCPALAMHAGGGKVAPAAREAPSLEGIAPYLAVCPWESGNIELEVVRPQSADWKAAQLRLAAGMGEPPTISVHLDPLEHHGMTGWKQVGNPPVGWFDEKQIDPADQARCVDAVRAAVVAASGSPSVLVMPELAATSTVLQALGDALRQARRSPALSVIGLYHLPIAGRVVPRALRGATAKAGHVNESVVLGPRGCELWRQRKLSKAYSKGPVPVPEDIAVGKKLTIVPTPIGIVTVAICLDSFQARARGRLASSGADVILVPSLSPSAQRHRTSLAQLVQTLWGAAFVCNRGVLDGHKTRSLWNAPGARSFWAIQRRSVDIPPAWKQPDHPSFVFRS